MKKNRITLLLVIGWIGLSGCTTTKPDDIEISISSGSEVRITNVAVRREGDVLSVTGNLRPISAATTRTGHVDVEFIGAQGNVLETVKAEPTAAFIMRSSQLLPAFSAKESIAGVASVRVTHHPDTMNECEL